MPTHTLVCFVHNEPKFVSVEHTYKQITMDRKAILIALIKVFTSRGYFYVKVFILLTRSWSGPIEINTEFIISHLFDNRRSVRITIFCTDWSHSDDHSMRNFTYKKTNTTLFSYQQVQGTCLFFVCM